MLKTKLPFDEKLWLQSLVFEKVIPFFQQRIYGALYISVLLFVVVYLVHTEG